MKMQRFSKWIPVPVLLGVMLVAGVGVMHAENSYAGSDQAVVLPDGFEQSVTGSFDGVNLKEKRIWIGDMVYLLDGNVRVRGTSTKLGLLSDLRQGEEVTATLRPNEDGPTPYVVEIIRQ
jgi:hypothetical protein